jgi:hypothetical protein
MFLSADWCAFNVVTLINPQVVCGAFQCDAEHVILFRLMT